ncbi:MAG TPA: glycosyltransferase family 2 protein [Gemmataceae bacterium]|nr:glycosyltransferase family 2 protein [Gemmataceae bacterium]
MISIIIPAFNEADGLRELHQRVTACATTWNEDYECILVDDGSRDNTLSIAEALARADRHLKIISLARNFGHQAAVTAGLEHAKGDLIAILDADLQDPPEELQRFFHKCREGYDIVYAIRTKRKEGLVKRASYWFYYRLLATLSNVVIPLDSGDFCVMNRRAVDALNALPERSRFVRGLRSWIGFRQTGLTYERSARAAGETKYTFRKLFQLGLDGIINFSSKPLRLIMVAGMLLGMLSFALAILVMVQYVGNFAIGGYNPHDAKGWTSLILAVLFLSSAQLFCLGIIGEYVGRLFEEVKRRPVYMVGHTVNLNTNNERTKDNNTKNTE